VTNEQTYKRLTQLFAKIVVPAFVAPAVVVSIVARLIPDRVAGRGLAHAAYTTIAIPSGLASLVVTVFLAKWIRNNKPTASIMQSAIVAAVTCGSLTAAISVWLVSKGYVTSRLFLDAIPSSAIGGAIAATQILKGYRSNGQAANTSDVTS
jgi:hypothetical protein